MRLALILSLAMAIAGCGRPTPARSAPGVGALGVHSAAIGANGRIATANSAYGAGLSLPVTWTSAPDARTYVVILDDPDAPGGKPFVHWLVWNIPAGITQLAQGAAPPAGARQGRNGTGADGYYGPHPPSGTHHYRLRVLALDVVLNLAAGADRQALADAVSGHVVGDGEVVGLFSPPGH
jgi:Raf kinase inhibitor-like YbhB/YbcL family protein